MHGVPAEEVHFHEVGALDSIIDIVGVAAGLVALAPSRIVCGPLPFATGMVLSAHGRYPLPAPATLELLRGWPQRPDASESELLTPTGAAIIAEVASFGPFPAMTLEQVGYGVGSRDSDRPAQPAARLPRARRQHGRARQGGGDRDPPRRFAPRNSSAT